QHQDSRALQRSANVVEDLDHHGHDVPGHRAVDIVGQRDEARLVAVEAHLPGQVQGIDGNAVPANPWPGVERHEAEGLGGGSVDDFLGADLQALTHEGELVGQRDVDVPEDVLVELGELGDLRRRDLVDAGDDCAVEGSGEAGAGGRDAADHLGDIPDLEDGVPRIDPLR